MKPIAIAAILSAVILVQSCTYDVESEVYGSPPACDTTAVSYSVDILPIMTDRCLGCHNAASANGGVALEPFDELLVYVDNGSFLCSIEWGNGCSEMPKNQPQIPPCEISKIAQWIADGAPEN